MIFSSILNKQEIVQFAFTATKVESQRSRFSVILHDKIMMIGDNCPITTIDMLFFYRSNRNNVCDCI